MAYRGLIPSRRLSWAKDFGGKMRMWLGKGRSFLCYPVSSGRLMNMVAFVPTNLESEESWTAPGDLNMLAAEYAGWDDPVLETIGALDQTFRWGIYDRATLPYWSIGRMTLLGDAAHPMVPHLGQGAAQAIEDGFTLAVLLAGRVTRRRQTARRHTAAEGLRKIEAGANQPDTDHGARDRQIFSRRVSGCSGTRSANGQVDGSHGMDPRARCGEDCQRSLIVTR